MYKYETHMHTLPVSACARATVRENVEFYKCKGYDGIFITNHFLDGNISGDRTKSYEEQIEFYFSDYEEAVKIGKEIGIKVFLGVEMSYKGTDFLVYGLDKQWFLNNPQIMEMKKSDELKFLTENGGYVVHAHPYRQDSYIDHIRLFPDCINGVEVINANRKEIENRMAKIYAENYGFTEIAGSDNHLGAEQKKFAGICTEAPIEDEQDFINRVKNREVKVFSENVE